ncbi:MAG: hypothetical protein L0Y79_05500 [Chlorobi bacterium]|nr:hypothetical protein [Chlorobiota bacterium]MCI0716479.1 hypothetical protein [Chlorobiota bacterium]
MISDKFLLKENRLSDFLLSDFLLFSFYLIITFLLYASSLSNYFVLDDFVRLKAASEGSLSENFHFFPVPLLVYRIFYLIFGLNPVPVRILHIIINSVVCFFVFKLSYRLFEHFDKDTYADKDADDKTKLLKSFLCSFLFCVHYIHVETIVYFSELHEMFYSLFYITGLYAYICYRKSNKPAYLIYVFALYSASLLSKETAVSFIGCIFWGEVFLFKSTFYQFLKKYYILFIITFLFLASRYFLFPRLDLLQVSFDLIVILAETFKNIIFTFTAFIVSLDFMLIKDIYKLNNANYVQTFLDVAKQYPLALLGISVSVIIYVLILKKRDKITYISLIYILITIASFVWLAGYERYLYLPSAGFCILLIHYLFKISKENVFKEKIIMVILALYFTYNMYNLEMKESQWIRASEISQSAVSRILDLTRDLPADSKVYFKNIPGEYKSAWVLRYGIHEIPELFLNRKNLFFYYISERPADFRTNESNVYVYDYYQDILYKVINLQ